MATHSIPPRGIEINQRTPEVDEVAIRAHLGLAPSFDPYQLDGSEEVERECGGFTVWTITKAGAPYFFRPQCSWRTGCSPKRGASGSTGLVTFSRYAAARSSSQRSHPVRHEH